MGRIRQQLTDVLWGSARRALLTSVAAVAALVLLAVNVPSVTQIATWVLVGSPLAILLSHFPNECKQLAGRVFAHLSAISARAELESVRQDLEGTLSIGAQRVRAHAPTGTVLNLRLDYIRSVDEVALLPDGTLLIGIAQHTNRERNLVAAAWAFARHGVLCEARPYLDGDVSTGLDLILAKELLEPAGAAAIREFLKTVWSPTVLGRERLRELTAKMEVIQDNRLLGPIAMSEFHELATSMGFRFPTDLIADETAAFVDYLHEIAKREPGTNIGNQTNFDGQAIRCRVVFASRPDVYLIKGPGPHRGAIDWAIRRAYHRVYLLASGQNVNYVREIIEPYRSDSRVLSVTEFPDSRRLGSGRLIRQLVVKVSVDVRYRVGIGQRPIVAVGPGRNPAVALLDEKGSVTG